MSIHYMAKSSRLTNLDIPAASAVCVWAQGLVDGVSVSFPLLTIVEPVRRRWFCGSLRWIWGDMMNTKNFAQLPLLIHTDVESADEYAKRIVSRAAGVNHRVLTDRVKKYPASLTNSEAQLLRAVAFLQVLAQ